MSWMNALSLGRQHAQEDRAIADQQRLGKLSAAALTASPDGRNKILGQVAAIDPNAAFGMRETFQREDAGVEEATRGRLVNMAKMLAAAPEPMRGGLYSQMVPGLRQMGLQAPDTWSPELMGVVQSLAGADQGAQSAQRAYVEWMAQQIPEAERGEFFRVQAGLAPKAQNQQFSPQRIEQADGTVRIDLVPTRGGNVAGGAPRPAGGMDAIIAQANALAQQGVPDEQIQQFIATAAQRQGIAVSPAGMDAAANRTLDAQTYGSPAGQATNATRAAAAAEAEAAKVRAAELARGEAGRINDAPKAVQQGEMLIANIDALLDDPNLEIATGASGVLDPRSWPVINRTSGVADTMARIEQIQGSAFLQAFESLKGGGAITEVEGKKAEQAIARLTAAQSDEGFRAALQDFRDAISPAVERARSRMGGEPSVVRTGTLPDGRRVRQMSDGRILDESGQEVR